MLVSHEVPIDMLEGSKSFNDYDYCLLHLTYQYPEYKQYYIDAIKSGRRTLLDNSLFELSDALTNDQLAQGVMDLNPTWYIIPDCLNDADTTIARFSSFIEKYSDLPGLKVGVAQGSTLQDIVRCYKYMSVHADKIAIPFDSEAFDELVLYNEDRLSRWCFGRQCFIKYLVDEGIWNNEKPHHLLGCSYAKEFAYSLYRKLNIETIDTSNPVVAAIEGLRYGDNGLDSKPSIKLCELIDYKFGGGKGGLTQDFIDLYRNTQAFKSICNRKWVAFFSQTGSEINNIRKFYNRDPDLIITNKSDFRGVNKELLKDCSDKIISLSDRPTIDEYNLVIKTYKNIFKDAIITLHGYLRIIPKQLCETFPIYNLHPGLITKYPELKGFNPQERAFDGKYETAGAVIHKVTPIVDDGEVICSKETSIGQCETKEEVVDLLHSISTDLWLEFFQNFVIC